MHMESVPLSSIRPSEGNPRSDFGDMETLCRQIRATGGFPVNPIIVLRDGGLFRIVDGERRFRALSIIHQADAMVPVVIADGWDEAGAIVAALATGTSAKALTEEEEQVGFQQSLLLGIDEETQADAIGCDVGTVRAARRKSAPDGWQGTLEQLAAANRFDGDDRDAILSAGSGWRSAARSAEVRSEREANVEAARSVLDGLGVECVDDVPDGYDWALGVVDPEYVEMAGGWPDGTVYVDDGDRLSVYVPHADDGAALRSAAARMSEVCVSMQHEAIRHVVGVWCGNSSLPSVALMREASRERRKLSFSVKDLSAAASMAARSTPSLWEMFTYLVGKVETSVFMVDGEHVVVGESKKSVLPIVDLALATGWEPSAAYVEVIEILRR